MMRRLATMTAVLALGLTGCTGGDDPDPTSDGTRRDGGTTGPARRSTWSTNSRGRLTAAARRYHRRHTGGTGPLRA